MHFMSKTLSEHRMAVSSRRQENPHPLPEKIGFLLQESRWLVVGALALFLALSLWGYHVEDPGWSQATGVSIIQNPAGRAGAWVSDVLLFTFGISAWWWIVLCLMFVWWGYRRLNGLNASPSSPFVEGEKVDRRPFYIALAGFVLLLVASSALEALRFHLHGFALPSHPGGLLGLETANFLRGAMGALGATLLLLAALAVGWSMFSGMSWMWFFECLGEGLERVYLGVKGLYERWQDQRIGKSVAEQREAVV
jgi:S-DNA-T family DNA segregation ATPase FtsK/SpoIIIE